jgi:hypothetical protein
MLFKRNPSYVRLHGMESSGIRSETSQSRGADSAGSRKEAADLRRCDVWWQALQVKAIVQLISSITVAKIQEIETVSIDVRPN